MAMAVKITRDLPSVTSCIDLSVRIVTKSPKIEPLLIFSISLECTNILTNLYGIKFNVMITRIGY